MKNKIIALAMLVSGSAFGQGIYRCGNTFTQTPCGVTATVFQSPPVRAEMLKALPDTPPPLGVIAANKELCTNTVRGQMKDPAAAIIGEVVRSGPVVDYFEMRSSQVVSYFVQVNGKNSYGAYTGQSYYTCNFDPEEKRIMRIAKIGS